jgi:hypothetical protein
MYFSSTRSNRLTLGVMFEENCSMERNSLEQSNNKQLSCRIRPLKIPPAASKYNSVISGFRSEVDENCTLLGYYAASRWDRNVAKKLPLLAA